MTSVIVQWFIYMVICLFKSLSYMWTQIFESNPNPCWIFDAATMKFLAVNNSCVHVYGFDRKELLNGMTIMDIRPADDNELLMKERANICDGSTYSGIWKHKNKGNEVFYVKIHSHAMTFEGKAARYV